MMVITKLQVKTKMLNKSLFNQLETTRVWKDDEVVGWVNDNSDTILLVQQYKGNVGQLKRVGRIAIWDSLALQNRSCPAEAIRECVDNYVHKFEQIFLG